jgi:hypothetical protein
MAAIRRRWLTCSPTRSGRDRARLCGRRHQRRRERIQEGLQASSRLSATDCTRRQQPVAHLLLVPVHRRCAALVSNNRRLVPQQLHVLVKLAQLLLADVVLCSVTARCMPRQGVTIRRCERGCLCRTGSLPPRSCVHWRSSLLSAAKRAQPPRESASRRPRNMSHASVQSRDDPGDTAAHLSAVSERRTTSPCTATFFVVIAARRSSAAQPVTVTSSQYQRNQARVRSST